MGNLKRRVPTPTVLQMEALECGAAALAMVLAHYGRWRPLEDLRADCGVSRDGSRAANILKAARAHGMQAKGLRVELSMLGQVVLPAILFWEFNHFVVLEGLRAGRRVLQRPGPRPAGRRLGRVRPILHRARTVDGAHR